MDGAEHGLIYISFGSVVKATSLPKEKTTALLEAMKEFPQRFIMKSENNDILERVDKNKLYVSNWLPQVDILGEYQVKNLRKVRFQH